MAGTQQGFDAAGFRDAIRFAMNMGLPETESERATFRWNPARTFTTDDPAGLPYDWTDTPATETVHADVQVPVAIEFGAQAAAGTDTPVGQIDTSRAVLTVLDEDYQQIVGANEVVLGGNTYDIDFVAPPLGLFEVTVYQIYASARDES